MERIKELQARVAKWVLLTQSSNCTVSASAWCSMWRCQDDLKLAWGSYRWELQAAVKREAEMAKYWNRPLRLSDIRRRLREMRGFRPYACRDYNGNYTG